jgi:hypothetical protein
LQAANRPHTDPWDELRSVAEHQNRQVNELWDEARLSPEELGRDPLE